MRSRRIDGSGAKGASGPSDGDDRFGIESHERLTRLNKGKPPGPPRKQPPRTAAETSRALKAAVAEKAVAELREAAAAHDPEGHATDASRPTGRERLDVLVKAADAANPGVAELKAVLSTGAILPSDAKAMFRRGLPGTDATARMDTGPHGGAAMAMPLPPAAYPHDDLAHGAASSTHSPSPSVHKPGSPAAMASSRGLAGNAPSSSTTRRPSPPAGSIDGNSDRGIGDSLPTTATGSMESVRTGTSTTNTSPRSSAESSPRSASPSVPTSKSSPRSSDVSVASSDAVGSLIRVDRQPPENCHYAKEWRALEGHCATFPDKKNKELRALQDFLGKLSGPLDGQDKKSVATLTKLLNDVKAKMVRLEKRKKDYVAQNRYGGILGLLMNDFRYGRVFDIPPIPEPKPRGR